MKKQILKLQTTLKITFIVSLILLMTGNILAQKNVLKISPLPLQSKFTLSYERSLNENSSLVLGYQKWFIESNNYEGLATLSWSESFNLFSDEENYINDGHRFIGAYRRYFAADKKWAAGFYGEANVFGGIHEMTFKNSFYPITLFSQSQLRSEISEEKVTVLGGGIRLGYQKQIKKFVIDVSTLFGGSEVLGSEGMKVRVINNDSANYIKPYKKDMNGAFVEFNFSIGMAF